ncbi:MAG: hypothetical protein FWH55_02480 [Oscillospiraceae bacterium]|nr:hypothetical protein [Oscillospiraceae bacterium]
MGIRPPHALSCKKIPHNQHAILDFTDHWDLLKSLLQPAIVGRGFPDAPDRPAIHYMYGKGFISRLFATEEVLIKYWSHPGVLFKRRRESVHVDPLKKLKN